MGWLDLSTERFKSGATVPVVKDYFFFTTKDTKGLEVSWRPQPIVISCQPSACPSKSIVLVHKVHKVNRVHKVPRLSSLVYRQSSKNLLRKTRSWAIVARKKHGKGVDCMRRHFDVFFVPFVSLVVKTSGQRQPHPPRGMQSAGHSSPAGPLAVQPGRDSGAGERLRI